MKTYLMQLQPAARVVRYKHKSFMHKGVFWGIVLKLVRIMHVHQVKDTILIKLLQ